MSNTKDEIRVSKNFVNLIKENEGLFYKTINRLFDIEQFSVLSSFLPENVKLEETIVDFGRMDILIENHNHFLIIENKVHNPTEAQESQTSSYFELMEEKEKEGKKTFICYLVNNGHPVDEFNEAIKNHQNSKIEYWNDLMNYLYKSADEAEKKNIEYFSLYSKDEIDNFELELDGKEKIFVDEAELLSNPFMLSTIENYFHDSETDLRILNSFVIPALNEIEGISDVHLDKDGEYSYAVFTYRHLEYWLNLTMFWNPKLNEWSYKNSFTFYKSWIVGCHEATSEAQMIRYTKDAILEWLKDKDAQSNILTEKDFFDESEKVFGADCELFSNPWELSKVGHLITSKKPKKQTLENDWIYQSIILPAAKKVSALSDPQICEYDREVTIKAFYNGIELYFDLSGFFDSKTNQPHYHNSFTFYRPWIIGCRYAKSEEQMIEYTKKALELWLEDVGEELQ